MKKQHPFYEILAKAIAYVFDNPEFENPVGEFLHFEGYRLDQSFDNQNTRLRTFGLLPLTAQKIPILVFGSSGKAIDDIANDHPKGIGFRQFIENRDAIAA